MVWMFLTFSIKESAKTCLMQYFSCFISLKNCLVFIWSQTTYTSTEPRSNQIYLVMFMWLTVDTSFISTKKSNIAKCFFDLSNAEIAVLPKIKHHFSNKIILKLKLSKNVFYKKCGPKLIFFNEKKIERFKRFLT